MSKGLLREELKKRRHDLSPHRRAQASEQLLTSLLPLVAPYSAVLSFASLSDEIDTTLLNRFLATTNRLILPKMCGEDLRLYQVTHLDKQLASNAFGLLEPLPAKCKEIAKEEIEIVLVPALGFDGANQRIGYGRGFYDRFLASIPERPSFGLGFKEQLIDAMPVESTDIALLHVYLF